MPLFRAVDLGYYGSLYGRIASAWNRVGNRLRMDITLPANTTATVFVPAREAANVTESGKPAAKAGGVKLLRMDGGAAVYAVGSGVYHFESSP